MLSQDEIPDPLWVFAYGSLMWKPGFECEDRTRARLDGYHRCFCMRSIHHRGSVANPGLVLALDPEEGASCEGYALKVAPQNARQVVSYLRERELISSAYVEARVSVTLSTGAAIPALAYVMDQAHEQYCGRLPLEEQARIIAHATGGMGPNREYLFATAKQLADMACPDRDLDKLSAMVAEIPASHVMSGGGS